MPKITNRFFPALAALFLIAAVSCERQVFMSSRPFADDATVYSAALDADSIFVVSHASWLKLGSGRFNLNVYATGPDGVTGMPYSLKRDLDLMDADAAPLLSGTLQLRTKAGSYTSAVLPLGRLAPGFYQLTLGDSLSFNIGVNPEKVVSPSDATGDFDAFW